MSRADGATAIVTVAMATATMALLGLLRPGLWLFQTLGLVCVVGLAMALARRWRAWSPGLVALSTVALYVNAAVAGGESLFGVIPTPESIGVVRRDLGVALAAVNVETPLGPHPEIFTPLLLTAIGLATFVAIGLAVDLGCPAFAGGPIAGPWIIAGVVMPDANFGWAVLSGAAYLALLAAASARQAGPGAAWPKAWAGAAVAVAAGAALWAAAAGPALPGWGSQERIWLRVMRDLGLSHVGPASGSVDLGLDLTEPLRRQTDTVLLRVTPVDQPDDAPPANAQLRLETRYVFNGATWQAERWIGAQGRDDDLIWPDADLVLDQGGDSRPGWSAAPDRLRVEVVGLETDDGRVPVTLGPRWLSGLGEAFYNPVTDSVRLAREPFDEWSYDVVTWRFDRAALAGLAADSEDAPANARRLPALPHGDEIAALAEAVTAGAESDLAKAEALVAYFRGPEFAYAIDTDYGDSEEPLWDFLQDKSGYCVHYATAMAVMARTLGLPTRVAVGFTAGTVVGDQGVREIRGANAHAWPEIHFERAGWVAFEPTPGLTGADEPEPEASAEPTPSAEPTGETTATVDVSATAAPSAGPAPDGPDAEALPLVWPWALAALAAVLVGAGAWGVRCWRRGHATVEQVWGALHAKALRRGWLTPGQSVRAAATALAARLDDPAARQALAELADLVETRRYAPPAAAPANLAAPSDAAAPPDIAMPSDAAAPSDTAVTPNAAAPPVLLVPPDAAETPDAAARRHRDRLAAAHLFRRFPGLSRPAPRRSLGR